LEILHHLQQQAERIPKQRKEQCISRGSEETAAEVYSAEETKKIYEVLGRHA
jgi:hypothetical protein